MAPLPKPVRVLDVGGTQAFWTSMGLVDPSEVQVTLLNLEQVPVQHENFTSVAGDARNMPQYADREFDVVFSNSCIEHVGTLDQQKQMASEVRRVGKRYFLQTPNRHFPLEPHFLFPGFQYIPLQVQIRMIQNFRLGHVPRLRDPAEARRAALGTRLMTKRELEESFPGAELKEERALGMVKSYICCFGF